MKGSIVNTSGYKFVSIEEASLLSLKKDLLESANALSLKGTILLGTEGINCFLSGKSADIETYLAFLAKYPAFSDIPHKRSYSEYQPFSRMLVRIKREIISMGRPEIDPEKEKAPYITPEVFKEWYSQGKDMWVLDTRNDYEVALGTFQSAHDLNIETFRDFPQAIQELPEEKKKKPVVTFCTGGVRCEKAGQYLINAGFEEVYQLEGGILNYFERCGGEYWHGECFVFDKRVAVDSQLAETATRQCYNCRGVLIVAEQSAACPTCGATDHLELTANAHV
eukprot:TRINITY_DN556_c1_g1_i1.p3 TRINITY_DN556_c1_g1~~TRINITY_DN556_c1_g1_i1.p3  ORF type:complete len:280 (+),score=-43.46 TRINITY_DN556_c1_g1_i1:8118-8957(+)